MVYHACMYVCRPMYVCYVCMHTRLSALVTTTDDCAWVVVFRQLQSHKFYGYGHPTGSVLDQPICVHVRRAVYKLQCDAVLFEVVKPFLSGSVPLSLSIIVGVSV